LPEKITKEILFSFFYNLKQATPYLKLFSTFVAPEYLPEQFLIFYLNLPIFPFGLQLKSFFLDI